MNQLGIKSKSHGERNHQELVLFVLLLHGADFIPMGSLIGHTNSKSDF